MRKRSKAMKTSGKPSVVFFGTGPLAAECLARLPDSFDVEAVITKPKPEKHRGSYPVVDIASKMDMRTLFVTNRAEVDQLTQKHDFKSRVAILVDFGILVSQESIDAFPLGIANGHFSRLPEWRGADPITFSLLSGQPTTAVSLMLLVEAMDEGPILGYADVIIDPIDTSSSLTEKLLDANDALLRTLIPEYIAGNISPQPQAATGVSYSKKLSKEDGRIVWTKPAAQIEREVRAYAGWPKSYTELYDTPLIITKTSVEKSPAKTVKDATPGTPIETDGGIIVTSGDGSALRIHELQPKGKKPMPANSFLAGYVHNR